MHRIHAKLQNGSCCAARLGTVEKRCHTSLYKPILARGHTYQLSCYRTAYSCFSRRLNSFMVPWMEKTQASEAHSLLQNKQITTPLLHALARWRRGALNRIIAANAKGDDNYYRCT